MGVEWSNGSLWKCVRTSRNPGLWFCRGKEVRANFSDTISEKTINHTVEIFSKCGKENCFGRTIVEEITGLKPSGASKLIKLLVDSEVIVPVTGQGKGKYRFQ